MFFNHKKNASSTVEYVTMIIVIVAAMLVIQKYLLRGMSGRWKNIGDTFGFGRQYDPIKTKECMFDMSINKWIGFNCHEDCIADCDARFSVGANKDCEATCPNKCVGVPVECSN